MAFRTFFDFEKGKEKGRTIGSPEKDSEKKRLREAVFEVMEEWISELGCGVCKEKEGRESSSEKKREKDTVFDLIFEEERFRCGFFSNLIFEMKRRFFEAFSGSVFCFLKREKRRKGSCSAG